MQLRQSIMPRLWRPGALHDGTAYREALTPSMFGVAAIVTCIYVSMIALIGPFGMYDTLSLARRLAYGGLSGCLDLMVAYTAFVLTLRFMRGRTVFQTMLALALAVPVCRRTLCRHQLRRLRAPT